MALTTSQIITILKLPGVGRKTAFNICEAGIFESFAHNNELFDWITTLSKNPKFARLSNVSFDDFEKSLTFSLKLQDNSQKNNIDIVSFYDELYPKALKEIDDKPLIINYKGNIRDISRRIGIAIIGTREPNTDGIKAGELIGKYFAERGGFNVVSGLAMGCDASAHRGCLMGNGFTTAILAHGLQTIYPKENKKLSEEILEKGGALISEYFYGTSALPNYFIERDRLQAGLSMGTIVIQTDIKGGTMHAVRATLESHKFLGAVEFNNEYTKSYPKTFGNQKLIREGSAMAVTYSTLNCVVEKLISQKTNIESERPVFKSKIPKQTSCF
jgi:DNA processing protein